jgi:hypothetical protein
LDFFKALFFVGAPQNFRAILFSLAASGLIALVFGLLLGGGDLLSLLPACLLFSR